MEITIKLEGSADDITGRIVREVASNLRYEMQKILAEMIAQVVEKEFRADLRGMVGQILADGMGVPVKNEDGSWGTATLAQYVERHLMGKAGAYVRYDRFGQTVAGVVQVMAPELIKEYLSEHEEQLIQIVGESMVNEIRSRVLR